MSQRADEASKELERIIGGFDGAEVAIVGLACRFPGADTPEEFWRNLEGGVESLTVLSDEQLLAAGVPREVFEAPDYVRSMPVLEGIEEFDAGFFGYTPLEVEIMDPQQRLFLECAWEALEDAGYDPSRIEDPVGVFAGAKTDTYLFQLFANRERFRTLDNFQVALGNDLAALATRVAFKMNLQGPAYGLHTACSTSLVGVHLACQSLLIDECRMAIAGGAAINIPQDKGYRYQAGGILSPDGKCRTFDARADGSNFGNGVGAVLLKRLEDALADGDAIYAVIRGSATNNDGAAKASFTAPGVDGQTRVILEAQAAAGVDAESISYIEAHGTATALGDSIEILALDQAFRASTDATGFCKIGSVKTNVGHLETAAGVAGLIKTSMALEREHLPASLHFEQPNPKIDFDSTAFVVQSEATPWPRRDGEPRRAGLSSFGIGSTNVHVILEEAPRVPPSTPGRPWQLLPWSARTETAADAMAERLATHLETRDELGAAALADVAHTLQSGRQRFAHRRAVVVPADASGAQVAAALRAPRPERSARRQDETPRRRVVFLFPGLGEQTVGMARQLYDTEEIFRDVLDRASEQLEPRLERRLTEVLFAGSGDSDGDGEGLDFRAMLGRGRFRGDDPAAATLARTLFAQPAIFAVEVALARLWMSWGVEPSALVGYSLGEYTAACVAGVLSFGDALELVAERARLIEELPAGSMLAVSVTEERALALAEESATDGRARLSLATVNGPEQCVLAGPPEAIDALEERLESEGVVCRRLVASHALHSSMMEPVAEGLTSLASSFELAAPTIPYLSNVTGTWTSAEESTDPAYWARHLTGTVRFADNLEHLLEAGDDRVLLEVGPGQSLTSFVKLHPAADADAASLAVASLPHALSRDPAGAAVATALGRLWAAGVEIDWSAVHAGERRLRTHLPTYPFERQRHWIDLPADQVPAGVGLGAADERPPAPPKRPDPADWFYVPVWETEELAPATGALDGPWLLLAGEDGGASAHLADALEERLAATGRTVVRALPGEPGSGLTVDGDGRHRMAPGERAGYGALLAELDGPPAVIVHLWGVDGDHPPDAETLLERGFYSLLALAQALGSAPRPTGGAVRLAVVSDRRERVLDSDPPVVAEKAAVLGPAAVVPREVAGVETLTIDLPVAGVDLDLGRLAERLLEELETPRFESEAAVAWRVGDSGLERRVRRYRSLCLERPEGPEELPLRQGGTYLITGGLGGVGLVIASALARRSANLVLSRRRPLPAREDWDDYLALHGDDDPTARVLRAVGELEAAGAQVLAVSADATDEEATAAMVAAAVERFGRVDGVVHAAGVGGGGLLQLKSRAEAERVLAPKVRGARVLLGALDAAGQSDSLQFLALFSSLQTALGDFGQVDYSAANAVLDALAEELSARGVPAVAIGWDNWKDVGIAASVEAPAGLEEFQAEILSKAIEPEEGPDVFERALAAATRPGVPRGPNRLVVTTQSLPERIELTRYYTGERVLGELGMPAPAPATAGGSRPRLAVPAGEVEARVTATWKRVLGIDRVGPDDNFFDLGGNSLVGMRLIAELSDEMGTEIPPVVLFERPTVSAITEFLEPPAAGSPETPAQASRRRRRQLRGGEEGGPRGSSDIAIVGLAGRFPGAADVDALWNNLLAGVESIRRFSDDELLAAGVDPAVLSDPSYVKARPVLDDVEMFDATLFGYAPREAEIMDPQHRLFLECCWAGLETAGLDPERFPGLVGVFAGSAISTYLLNLYSNPELMGAVGSFQAMIGNEKDSLPTRVSYKLNLRGPSLAVQTFCSTSLVATHLACRSLADGDCDVALAGGASIHLPQTSGYHYQDGGFVSSDGHLKAFDASADGFLFGNGVGVVVLERLDDALAAGHPIRAVIKGSAINNDGSGKVGYTATSVEGQAEVIAAALDASGVEPKSIGYIESHGTGTALGDPVEIAALTRAFREMGADDDRFCGLGSIKTNIGHLDRAAGVTGLIKAVLTLEREEIPPILNFREPNPNIDFESSPFELVTESRPWRRGDGSGPRRAGVNSLGLGGTNAHVVLEEAPTVEPTDPAAAWQLLTLSAQTPGALERMTERLARHLETADDTEPAANLADVAYTLQTGRRQLPERRAILVEDLDDARRVLGEVPPGRVRSGRREDGTPSVVFLFPGLGSQYVGMAAGLYLDQPVFRDELDRAARLLADRFDVDLMAALYPDGVEAAARAVETGGGGTDLKTMLGRATADDRPADEVERHLARTEIAQPALFAFELALARLWLSLGVTPDALCGYSLGEYVAACLAGVLSLEDALELVTRRARLVDGLDAGAMVALGRDADGVGEILERHPELSLSAVNGPFQVVVAGPAEAVERLVAELDRRGEAHRRLATSHAFHSSMMESVADELTELARGFDLAPPTVPLLSNLTGTWLSAEEATDPSYWAHHLCRPVQLGRSVETLAERTEATGRDVVLLEVGPGQTLSSLVLQHPALGGAEAGTAQALASLGHRYETSPDRAFWLGTVGRLWLAGVRLDWDVLYAGQRRRRLVLPTYPFERERYWVDAVGADPSVLARRSTPGARADRRAPADWFSTLSFVRTETPERGAGDGPWLVFADAGAGLGEALVAELAGDDRPVAVVTPRSPGTPGEVEELADERPGVTRHALAPADPEAHRRLVAALSETWGRPPAVVAHLWGLDGGWEAGLTSPASLAAALADLDPGDAPGPLLGLVTGGAFEVTGDEAAAPLAALAAGVARVVPRELPELACRLVDVAVPPEGPRLARLARQLVAELSTSGDDAPAELAVAYRGPHRWVPELVDRSLGAAEDFPAAGTTVVLTGADTAPGEAFARWLEQRDDLSVALLDVDGGADRMAAALERVRDELGPVSLVIHAAGESGASETGRQALRELAADGGAGAEGASVHRRRLEGLEALDGALEAHRAEHRDPPPARLAVSYLSSLVGGLGLAGEAAASTAVEAWALAGSSGRAERAADDDGWRVVSWGVGPGDTEGLDDAVGRLVSAAVRGRFRHLVMAPRPLPATWNRAAAEAAPAGVGGRLTGYQRPDLRVAYVEPRNDAERAIAGIWEELLGVSEIGVHDDFLELGGDSLMATRLISRMREIFGLDLPIRLFFEASTVEELGRAVERLQAEDEEREISELMARLDDMSEEEIEAELVRRSAEVLDV